MQHRIKYIVLAICAFSVSSMVGFACSKSHNNTAASTAPPDTTAAVNPASKVSVLPTLSILTVGQSTTVTVSGGSGTYVSASATEGTISALSAGVYNYVAPASTTMLSETITVTDSAGIIGTAYIAISGSTTITTSTPVNSCTGVYDTNIADIPATLHLLADASSQVSGYIYMMNYYYPVFGTCTVGGRIAITNMSLNQPYMGTVGVNANQQLYLAGTVQGVPDPESADPTSQIYAWAAQSQTPVTTVTAPTASCEGTYTATIAGAPGILVFVQDGGTNISGYLNLTAPDGTHYFYMMSGTCAGSGGAVSFTNLTTGSPYTGTMTSSNLMSGTFTTANGTYNWSATK